MPEKAAGISRQIIMSAEKVIRHKRRMPCFEVPSYFCQDGEDSGQVIVGEEVAGAPYFKDDENEKAAADIIFQQRRRGVFGEKGFFSHNVRGLASACGYANRKAHSCAREGVVHRLTTA